MCLTKPIKTCTNPALHVLIRASTDSLNSDRMGHLHHNWLQFLLAVGHSHTVISDRCFPPPPCLLSKLGMWWKYQKTKQNTRILKSTHLFIDQSGKRNHSTGANCLKTATQKTNTPFNPLTLATRYNRVHRGFKNVWHGIENVPSTVWLWCGLLLRAEVFSGEMKGDTHVK